MIHEKVVAAVWLFLRKISKTRSIDQESLHNKIERASIRLLSFGDI
jgi:hypothetical protein